MSSSLGKKVLVILLIFTIVYTIIIFASDFGIPNTIDYQNNYPCHTGLNKYKGGFVFENCYVLKIPFYKEEIK